MNKNIKYGVLYNTGNPDSTDRKFELYDCNVVKTTLYAQKLKEQGCQNIHILRITDIMALED